LRAERNIADNDFVARREDIFNFKMKVGAGLVEVHYGLLDQFMAPATAGRIVNKIVGVELVDEVSVTCGVDFEKDFARKGSVRGAGIAWAGVHQGYGEE
jgi:hypothetical protein